MKVLATVIDVVDAEDFVATYRGGIYEGRAAPNSWGIAVGDVLYCHLLPASGELLYADPSPNAVLTIGAGDDDADWERFFTVIASGPDDADSL